MESELYPIVSGLLIGALVGLIRPSLRFRIGFLLAVVFGALATILSGEAGISWAFLLIDIPLVAISAAAGLYATRTLRLTQQRSGIR